MSADVARRTALAAQGFADRPVTGPVTRAHLRRVLTRTQLLQLDSVSVAVRAHYVPVFSRLGAYPRELLDDVAWRGGVRGSHGLVEYWAHEAALVPAATWPLLRWRMRDNEAADSPRYRAVAARSPGLTADVLAAVAAIGPAPAGRIEAELGAGGRTGRGPWWDRSDTKVVCEWLFAAGRLTTGTRVGFARHYDLPERVLPAELLAQDPPVDEAVRALVEKAAVALGVATEPDLRDYFRLPPGRSRAAVAELVAAGVLEPVEVLGWGAPAYRHHAARTPREVTGATLLCPFDPLVFFRPRAERVFGFRYRLEIYTPAPQRVHGYYVYPFLLDGRLVGRVDLKADREAGTLHALATHAEDGVSRPRVGAALAGALADAAGWLGLDRVVVAPRGDLAPDLARAV
ncbi:winged helix-turn-helix domain-containing protein [Rhodococcus aerolatus]